MKMRGPVEKMVNALQSYMICRDEDFVDHGSCTMGDECPSRVLMAAEAGIAPHTAGIDRAWVEHAALLAVELAARYDTYTHSAMRPCRCSICEALAALDAVRAKEGA